MTNNHPSREHDAEQLLKLLTYAQELARLGPYAPTWPPQQPDWEELEALRFVPDDHEEYEELDALLVELGYARRRIIRADQIADGIIRVVEGLLGVTLARASKEGEITLCDLAGGVRA